MPGDGGGDGVGSAQVGGAGPNLIPFGAWTTTLVTANCAPFESPEPHEPSSGTQPVHCVDAMAAPVLSIFCLICSFSVPEGPPLTGMIWPFLYWVIEPSSPNSVLMWNWQESSR